MPPASARSSRGARRASAPLRLDCGVELGPFTVAYQTYGTLERRAQSNAVLVCHALTGDQFVAEHAPGHRQAGLVGDDGRARQAARHRPLLRHLRQRARRLHGHHRADGHSTRPPASPRASTFPVITDRRHGAGAEAADRPSRHRAAVLRRSAARWAACRCCNGPRAIRSACSPRCRSPRRRGIRRRTSPSTRSAARRSWPIRTGAAATT